MKKEIRFTTKYGIFYKIIFTIGKIFSFVKFFKYNLYLREFFGILRAGSWSLFIKKIGEGSKIDSSVTIRYNPKKLQIGKYTHIDCNVHFEVHEDLKIGDYVHICPNVYIQSGDKVIIEDYACISNGAKLYSKSNTYDKNNEKFISLSSNAPLENQVYKSKPINIRRNAFIGINVVILPGVTIGENSIVGAGSVVIKDVPSNTIVAGVPAEVIKRK